MRSLYGNHDAWPGTLPGLLPGSIAAQRTHLGALDEWNPGDWLASPLSVALPGGDANIESSPSTASARARQRYTCCGKDRRKCDGVAGRSNAGLQGGGNARLRILAMHHPLGVPWEDSEVRAAGVFSAMKLLKDEERTRRLHNDKNDPVDFGPLVHLVLSGHTHLAHPATASAVTSSTYVKACSRLGSCSLSAGR